MPKVSVLMPAFNAARFVGESIESVLAQTLRDWELIIVDDGSTDGTAEVVRSYDDRRICLISQENQGEGAARNTGLQNAQGEYLAFLDADDWFISGALASNVNILDKDSQNGAVYSDGYYCRGDGTPVAKLSEFRPGNPNGNVLDTIAVNPLQGAVCAVMLRRAAVERRMLRFDPTLRIGTDWDFLIRLAETEGFTYNPAVTCRYRLHGGNVSMRLANERDRELARVRWHVISAAYFSQLRRGSQYLLFYQLLFENYAGSATQQQATVECDAFRRMNRRDRAKLLRLVAQDWLINRVPLQAVGHYATLATQLDPSWRNLAFALAVRMSPKLTRRMLSARQRHKQSQVSPFMLAQDASHAIDTAACQ